MSSKCVNNKPKQNICVVGSANLITTILFFIFSTCVFSQKTETPTDKIITEFLCDLTESINFDSVNIVVLGEDKHSNGTAINVNQSIINELVKKYNFEILLIESDFYSLYKYNFNSTITFSSLKNSIYKNWSYSIFFQKTMQLIKNKELSIYGFDSRMTGEISKKYFLHDCVKSFKNLDSNFIKTSQKLILNEFKTHITKDDLKNHLTIINSLIELLKKDASFKYQRIINYKNFVEQILTEKSSTKKYIEKREYNMICNLKFLMKNFKNKKVIVLGANLHLMPNIVKLSKHANSNVGDELYKLNTSTLFLLPFVYQPQLKGKKDSFLKELHENNSTNIQLINKNTIENYEKYSVLKNYLSDFFIYIDTIVTNKLTYE